MITKEAFQNNGLGEITAISLPERSQSQSVRERLAFENYDPERIVSENEIVLQNLSDTPFRRIGQKFVKGEPLTFEEAFLGMVFVTSATNSGLFEVLKGRIKQAHGIASIEQSQLIGPAQTFLTAMAQREVADSLTVDEISGMVASAMMDINLRLGCEPYVLETGGMGGDKGFIIDGVKKKVINASTLSAVVLSSLGIPTVKHGSYANTSAVGSTEAIEAMGVNIFQDSYADIQRLFEATNFYFSDAHIAKTIHDLSHSPFMRHETVNHIIGPMTPPVDREAVLNKIIGVNEGVYPGIIAQAYAELRLRGFQKVGNVVVISGLSQDFTDGMDYKTHAAVKPYMMLDELSPYKSLLGVVRNGTYIGCYTISPEDFGISLDARQIHTVNSKSELLAANGQALEGLSQSNSDYLAMNTAIGLFTAEYLSIEDSIADGQINKDYLRECFNRCRLQLESGRAALHLAKIVEASTNI